MFFLIYFLKKNKLAAFLSSKLESSKTEISNLQSELQIKDNNLVQVKDGVKSLSVELNTLRESITNLTADKKALESRLDEREKLINSYLSQIEGSKNEFKELNQRIIQDEKLISELKTTIDKDRELSEEKLSLLNEAKEKLSVEFQNLGNKIFEDKSKKFTDQNKESMEGLLNPLREQIKDFDKKVSDTYEKETRERASLQTQIEQLKNLNERISQDAINLTSALKGDSKAQGIWGEIKLERILESSGLAKGSEFEIQESFRDEEGKIQRPDVIIHLPEGKDIIIDSKVSLTAYEKYCSTDNEEEKEVALKQHITSINNHIRNLNSKQYEELKQINTLDFVLMFIPIDSAFMLAVQNDNEITKNAYDRNIGIVCPSTLLTNLRAIHSMWKIEYQNRNAQVIADKAGKLYDRFVDFVNHLENVGSRLNQAGKAYEDAMKSLSTGRGNILKRVTELQKLGIKNKKSIPVSLVDDDVEESKSNEDFSLESPKSK